MKKILLTVAIIALSIFGTSLYYGSVYNIERNQIEEWTEEQKVELINISRPKVLPDYWNDIQKIVSKEHDSDDLYLYTTTYFLDSLNNFPDKNEGRRSRVLTYKTGDKTIHKLIFYFDKDHNISGINTFRSDVIDEFINTDPKGNKIYSLENKNAYYF